MSINNMNNCENDDGVWAKSKERSLQVYVDLSPLKIDSVVDNIQSVLCVDNNRSHSTISQMQDENPRAVILRNLQTDCEVYDVLHKKSFEVSTNTS